MKDVYEHVTVNLYLTMRCNFKCGHCMMHSSPDRENRWMSDELLTAIFTDICEYLKTEETEYFTLNFVGGEPTLDLDEFQRCMDLLDCYWLDMPGVSLEMTSNGWWAEKPETLDKFLRVMRRQRFESDIGIRISGSNWHDYFRSPWMKRFWGDLPHFHENLSGYFWESMREQISEEVKIECPYCESSKVEETVEGCTLKCAECDNVFERFELEDNLLQDYNFSTELESLYYDDTTRLSNPLSQVSATGRGALIGGYQPRTCHRDYPIIGIDPSGEVRDLCCNGSNSKAGMFSDRSLSEWFAYTNDYYKYLGENMSKHEGCRSCKDFYRIFHKQNKNNHKKENYVSVDSGSVINDR